MQFDNIEFLLSAHRLGQLPPPALPELAFAGRSNVGKSSLINTLLGRKALVKVSARPGKTQGLNFFKVENEFYLVDLPGYGFARVSKGMQENWQALISAYIETRETLKGVVVIIDIRHEPKQQDTQLITWLRQQNVNCIPVYTKIDKISGSIREKHARMLDAGHGISPEERILFSAKTGQGRNQLLTILTKLVQHQ